MVEPLAVLNVAADHLERHEQLERGARRNYRLSLVLVALVLVNLAVTAVDVVLRWPRG